MFIAQFNSFSLFLNLNLLYININMNIKPFLTLILLFSIFCSHAQNEAAIWYFGNNAGVDFNSGVPVTINDGQLTTNEGCATISNSNGELLFYTDGITVWDRTHNIMLNGTGLLGDPSSTQSGIIVPKPNDSDTYYIFTVAAQAGISGLNYSEVDMTLNSGNGGITAVKNVLLETPTTEKISAISHANGTDIWVVSHGWENADFLVYAVTAAGINETPIVSSVGEIHGADGSTDGTIGYLKIAPNGEKLALAKAYGSSFVEIFDFDNATGIVSNPILLENIFFQTGDGPYGIEFSPNSSILYVSDVGGGNRIHQFDISFNTAADIINSDTIIFDGNIPIAGLQLAIDQKIYVAQLGSSFLGVIETPDVLGSTTTYIENAVDLGNATVLFGLPPFIQSFFNIGITTENVCLGETSIFSVNSSETIDSILWEFGDGTTSDVENPTHNYTSSGIYTVSVTVVSGTDSVDLTRDIVISEVPTANTISNYIVCDDSSNDGEEVFNLSIKDSEIIGGQSNTQFAVSYFLNQEDADNNENVLDNNYTNTSNEQEIFARIYNVDNGDCYAVTSFNLIVSQFPLANTISDIVLCDDASEDGVEFINLLELNDAVLNGQPASDFNVSYHFTQTEANDGLGALPNNFETIDNPQPIYIRVENASNALCYSTSMFMVIIDDFFELNLPNDLFLCDDVSNDTVEFFNLAAQSADIIEGLDGNYNVTYHTSQDDANTNTDNVADSYENTSNPQEIFVRVEKTTNALCFQTTSFFIEVKETPVLDMDTTSYICTGEELVLTATPGYDTYLWSTGEESNSITIYSAGSYTVTVSSNYGTDITCSVTETITVIESNEAVFNTIEVLDWSPNTNSIQVFVEGIGNYEYSINGIDYQDSPIFTYLEAGEYNVYVRDKFGCGIIQEEVFLLFYPYYFTPNNDGVHDFWQIKFSETEPDLVIKIFDRYGKWLTNINPRGRGWDGTFKGKLLPASDYWFVVTRPSNNKEYTGHFTLKR